MRRPVNSPGEGADANADWAVYMIRCDDGSLYTGITTDIERRLREHGAGPRGARYFAGRTPQKVVYLETGHSRASASRREAQIKKLSRSEKLTLAARGAAAREN